MTNLHFNSHAHVERDVMYYSLIKEYYDISTHTLTWSVTGMFIWYVYLV